MAVNWNEIAVDGRAAFAAFTSRLVDKAFEDPRWRIISQFPAVVASFADFRDGGNKPTDNLEAISIHASMGQKPTSGDLYLQGPEHWEFARSEALGAVAVAVLSDLLTRASLVVVPTTGRDQGGRNSFWEVLWRIYPESHPMVAKRWARN